MALIEALCLPCLAPAGRGELGCSLPCMLGLGKGLYLCLGDWKSGNVPGGLWDSLLQAGMVRKLLFQQLCPLVWVINAAF